MNEVERFWSKVAKAGDDECWLWAASIEGDSGYAVFFLEGGRKMRGHRYSLMLKLGRPLVAGAYACHICHVRACVNPSHLYEGDALSNSRDAVNAGRHMRGSMNPCTRLTEEDVRTIRRIYLAGGVSQAQLAQQFGVNQSEISRMTAGKSWKHVA